MIRILFLLSLALSVRVALGQDDRRVLQPVIEVGDKWTYRGINVLGPGANEYELQVSSVGANVIQAVCTRKSDGKEFDGTWTDEWSATTNCNGLIFRPPARYLRFPLSVGSKYSAKFDILRPRVFTAVATGEATVSVSNWETVAVPAGKFRSLRVDIDSVYRRPDAPNLLHRQFTIWYSPEVRRWVKWVSKGTDGEIFEEELMAFKLVE